VLEKKNPAQTPLAEEKEATTFTRIAENILKKKNKNFQNQNNNKQTNRLR